MRHHQRSQLGRVNEHPIEIDRARQESLLPEIIVQLGEDSAALGSRDAQQGARMRLGPPGGGGH
jgi:hypothetical protein